MAYVITELCVGVKDRACVEVCPVDCIHDADDSPQMYINPSECIDCRSCETECPVGAIYSERDVPDKWRQSIAVNMAFFD
ncbi:ferredoxin family protein [bacterium]|nr:MAG: ferredoxin family protein [bacterium]